MTDPIQTAFAELRTTEQPRVAPPGVDAARRTVRGRRQRRLASAGAAALAAAAMLGAGYLIGADQTGPSNGPDRAAETVPTAGFVPADPPGLLRGGDHDEIYRLVDLAREGLGLEEGEGVGVIGGYYGSGHRSEDGEKFVGGLGNSQGTYLLRVSCAGAEGSVTITARTVTNEVRVTARCGATAAAVRAGVGEATLILGPDDRTYDGDDARFADLTYSATDDELRLTGLDLIRQ